MTLKQDLLKAVDECLSCDEIPQLRTVIYGLKEEKEPLEYWIEHFKNDNSVLLYDVKSDKIFYKGEDFNRNAQISKER